MESNTQYRAVLEQKISENAEVRGYLRALAKAAGCHPSFLSQVRRGSVHLTPDHAAGLCRHWDFTEDETEWFLALVLYERAGAAPLRAHLKKRLDALHERRSRLSKRVGANAPIPVEHQVRYYTSWQMSALHVLSSVPACRAVSALAARLALPEERVRAALGELEAAGLLEREPGGAVARVTGRSVHVADDSPLHWSYHAAWRHQAIARAPASGDRGLHYTAAYALSERDFARHRELLLGMIEASRALVGPSKEETGACLLVDWLPL